MLGGGDSGIHSMWAGSRSILQVKHNFPPEVVRLPNKIRGMRNIPRISARTISQQAALAAVISALSSLPL